MKKSIFICMLAMVLLAFTAGFGGAMLANFLQNPQMLSSAPSKTNPETSTTDANGGYVGITESAGNGHYLNASENAVNDNDVAAIDTAANNAYVDKDKFLLAADITSSFGYTPLTIPQIVTRVSDTVVEIATESVSKSSRIRQYVQSGAGSGVIISSDGYIVTNNHVIEGASKITVRLKNGITYDAKLIGRDIKTDLAVVKIELSGLNAAQYGDSSRLEVGELAVAIGNPLGELGGTVTNGIISALNRDITIDGEMMNLLQTSAAVNPGNSGGGLYNEYGELIGIVNAKSGGSNIEGIGFAIPSNTVKIIVNQLIDYGYVQGRVDFGITLVDITDMFTAMRYGVSSLGVYVGRNDEDSGLQAGDRIVSVNDKEVRTSEEVKAIYVNYEVGDTLSLVIARDGQNYKATVVLKQAMN